MNNIKGLSASQVIARRKKYGYNDIPSKQDSDLVRLLKKLWSPIPWMIEIAAFLSFLLGKWEDFIVIIVLLFVNIFVDYKQESKALNALEILKKKLAKKALVFRDGKFKEIEARFLVPGDVIKLKIGDVVPADAKLIKGEYLEIDQSSLTGESLPVDKVIGDSIYSNSVVKIGEMLAEVISIGKQTYFGKSAVLVEKAQTEVQSNFQKAVIRIGSFLIMFTAVLAVFIIIISVFRHDNFLEVLQFILILVVASIPVALPAVLSVTMAVGAISIAKRKAIVSDLSAIEELAGIDILCIDKTGTLTQNSMSISEPLMCSKFNKEKLFTYAVLASNQENKDPIEIPIFEYLEKNFPNNKLTNFKRHKFIPFDPVRKRTEVQVSSENKKITIIKGAPQVIVSMCDNDDIRERCLSSVQLLAKKGYRTLAVAVKNGEKGKFQCVGLIPLFDPPRKDSAEVINDVKENGIDIKMLTGDNHAIAVQIARVLKIGSKIIDTSKLSRKDSSEDFVALNKHIENANGFSQVMPADKYAIIEELQKNEHIVAMTGDGVNDAPALSRANIGIAVSGATDAARAAADLILLSPGLSVINHAIYIARQTFERMKAYAIFRIAETIRIILFISISIIVFNFYPMTAIMIIMLALLNDIPVMMIAYDNAPFRGEPVRWDMKEVLIVATVLGLAGVLSSFFLFYWLHLHAYPLLFIQSLLFIKLDVAGHSTLYLTRTGRRHFWSRPYPSLKFFLPAFGSRIIGTLIAVYGIFMVPIGWKYAFFMWLYAIAWWIFNDFVKVTVYKMIDRKKTV